MAGVSKTPKRTAAFADVVSPIFKKWDVDVDALLDEAALNDVVDLNALSELVKKHARDKDAEAEQAEQKQTVEHRAGVEEVLADLGVSYKDGSVEVELGYDGGLEEDGIQYFYGPSSDVRNEFDTKFSLEASISFEDASGDNTFWIYALLRQEMDVGSDKVIFDDADPNVEFTTSLDTSYPGNRKLASALFKWCIEDVGEPMKSTIEYSIDVEYEDE